MLHWWPLRTDREHAQGVKCTAFRLEELESREVPAVLIQVDYSFDTGFFSNNSAARSVMEQVAAQVGNSISRDLIALSPGGANTWTASFFNPATGVTTSVPNLSIGADTIKVFVGARPMSGNEAGFAGSSGYSASGDPAWVNAVGARDWGGSITFDSKRSWYFGQSADGLTTSQIDFYSVALHELGHVLGIGTSTEWSSLSSGGSFHGANAMSVYGGPVPLAPDGMHWADGLTVDGQPVSMDPALAYGQRVTWSSLDTAALRDLGWGPAVAATAVSQPIVVTSGGSVSLAAPTGGSISATNVQFAPFPGYTGEVSIATGDFNGDGATDYAFATGVGIDASVEIVNGRDGSFLVGPTVIFPGFTGGLSIAAGDIDGDGKAELIVGVSTSAPPIVQVYHVNGGLQLATQFIAFDAAWFPGGLRVAAGDINDDGYADVVVTTASMVGAVAVYNGKDLGRGHTNYLLDPFVPLPGSPLSINAAVGDMDGDGYADLALTFGRGGPALVGIWSGALLTHNPHTPLNQLAPMAAFLALPPDDLSGARLAMRDLDGDGKADLVVAGGSSLNPVVRVYGESQPPGGGVLPAQPGTNLGINVA